jgi:hypothetical protein
MILASDRRQAAVIFGYIKGFLEIPLLRTMVTESYKESIILSNGVRIEIHTSSFRLVRGFTCIAALADELAFWSVEGSANPDKEILNALRPSLASTGGLLLALSSPYAKKGELWNAYTEHYGKDDSDVLVWKASSRAMNSTLSMVAVARAYARDYAAAAAEYGAEFRNDIENFLATEKIEEAVVRGRTELPYEAGQSYFAFVDPSGGVSDSMTLGIAHNKDDRAVLDLIREVRPPFSPESVVGEFAAILKAYGIYEVHGDRYAGSWPAEQFAKRGITYKSSEQNRSELYIEFLAAIMSGAVELLDDQVLKTQLAGLERRTATLGRDSIDHGAGQHDDVANAAAGALVLAGSGSSDGLGLIQFYEALKTGAVRLARWPKPKPKLALAPVLQMPSSAPPGLCCANFLRQQLPGGGVRCGNCGRQSNMPIPAADGPCACNPALRIRIGNYMHCNGCAQQWAAEGVTIREPYRPKRSSSSGDGFSGYGHS